MSDVVMKRAVARAIMETMVVERRARAAEIRASADVHDSFADFVAHRIGAIESIDEATLDLMIANYRADMLANEAWGRHCDAAGASAAITKKALEILDSGETSLPHIVALKSGSLGLVVEAPVPVTESSP